MWAARALVAIGCFAVIEAAATPGAAREMKLTVYGDGRSCPGDCDAHVVLHRHDNGTRHAFAPSSDRSAPARCEAGQPCRICFGEPDDTCMTVLYRGAGPARGRFDFTSAFYDANCGRPGVPAAVSRQCASMDRAARDRGYRGSRINCFAEPGHARCEQTMRDAAARQTADAAERERCLGMGEAAYNGRQSDPLKHRSLGCNYTSRSLGGPNSKGDRWRLLLPGACRAGTHVGRDGLDCCSADVRFAASIHPECSDFFPKP